MRHYNPFQNDEIRVLEVYYPALMQYTRTKSDAGKPSDPDDSPFDRYIDMWFLAFCLGAREGRATEVNQNNSRRFIWGSIFESDPHRVELLELVALAHSGDPQILADPHRVIGLANALAATGFPLVIDMVQNGQSLPIWRLTDQLMELLEPDGSAEKPSEAPASNAARAS